MKEFDFFHWTFIDRLNDPDDSRIDVYEQRTGDIIGGLYPQYFGMDLKELQDFFNENMKEEQDLFDWIYENIEWY